MTSNARDKAATLTCWSGVVEPESIGGGISNQNSVIRNGDERYVVRIGDDVPAHNVVRWHELAASRAAHAAGVSPAVVYREPGAFVFDFIDGRTYTEPDVREPQDLQ